MTRDEMIKLARETGVEAYAPTCMAAESYSEFLSRLERFAALVAEAEREAILRHATPAHDVDGHCEIVAANAIRARGGK